MTTGMKHLAAYQANLLDYNAAKDRECNYIGNQIRAARKSMKLSLEQLSQILMGYGVDIGRVAVNKWEQDIVAFIYKNVVANSVAYMMMSRLGIDTDGYFELDDFRDVTKVIHVKPGDRVTINVETFCGECLDRKSVV